MTVTNESYTNGYQRPRHPTVSIVLVTYNRPAGLAETIQDLLCQSYRDFELIICDDASPDLETSVVCLNATYRDTRVVYFRQESNVGMPGNLNSGIDRSRGRYIAIVHDGDRYDRDLIKCWLDALLRCKDALFVFNQYAHLNPDGTINHISRESLQECNMGITLIQEYFRRWRFDSPVWGTVMVARTALIDEGLFDTQYGFYADVDMWLRLSERGHVGYVNQPLVQLANRTTWPRQFHTEPADERRIVRKIVFRSRKRVTKNRPFRFAFELVRHGLFYLLDGAYVFALTARRHSLRRS